MRRAVGKKMLSLAGPTAGAAGRVEVLRGEVWGVGVCRRSDMHISAGFLRSRGFPKF